MSAARASLFEIIVAGRLVQHAHFRRMSHAKRLFLQKPMLAISQFGEDVPSEIVIFGSLQGALGAILGPFGGSCSIVFTHFENDIESMLRRSHFFEDVPSEMGSSLPCWSCWSAVLLLIF